MNREQMVLQIGDIVWMSTASVKDIATAILDAILPQVATVEELEALPGQTWLIGRERDGGDQPSFWQPRGFTDLAAALEWFGPFVIWRPEP